MNGRMEADIDDDATLGAEYALASSQRTRKLILRAGLSNAGFMVGGWRHGAGPFGGTIPILGTVMVWFTEFIMLRHRFGFMELFCSVWVSGGKYKSSFSA